MSTLSPALEGQPAADRHSPPASDSAAVPRHPTAAAAPAARYEARLTFDGQGRAYFRVWIVHLLLNLLSLGLYSPWAKVRKLRWFAQHTLLLGDRFDFHGDPRRMLVGRLLALGLLLLWSLAFDVSAVLGWITLGLLLLLGPWLFASAQRFRLSRLSWRGLRFGFTAPLSAVYRVGLPALALWSAGTVMNQLQLGGDWLALEGAAFALAVPALHAGLRRLQHNHARYGDQRFGLRAGLTAALYGVYARALFLLLLGALVGAALGAGLTALLSQLWPAGGRLTDRAWLGGVGLLLGMAALGGPLIAAQVQQQVWRRTHIAGLCFEGRMRTWPLMRLCVVQGLAVLLTAGLYWPWAAVALARYRVQSVVLVSDDPIEPLPVTAARTSATQQTTGDAAGDLFGLDVGW